MIVDHMVMSCYGSMIILDHRNRSSPAPQVAVRKEPNTKSEALRQLPQGELLGSGGLMVGDPSGEGPPVIIRLITSINSVCLPAITWGFPVFLEPRFIKWSDELTSLVFKRV